MDTPFDPTLENDIKQLLTEVPPPIRAFFVSGKVEIVAKNLIQKNQLHIDQGAIVEREIILLLLGLKDPAEFMQALAEDANLDQKVINGIVQDVNNQIFIPLREEMGSEGAVTPEPVKPAVPAMPPRHIINKIQTPENKMQHPMSGEKLLEDHEEPSPSLKATEGATHIEFAKPAVPPPSPRFVPPPTPPARPYASDPYREPVDEK